MSENDQQNYEGSEGLFADYDILPLAHDDTSDDTAVLEI